MRYEHSYYNALTDQTVITIVWEGEEYGSNILMVNGDHTGKPKAEQLELAKQRLRDKVDPDGAISRLQEDNRYLLNQINHVEDQLPVLYDGNTQIENLAYAVIANSNGKDLWPGQYAGQAKYFDDLTTGTYVPGQMFKFEDSTNDAKVGAYTIGRVRNDWTTDFTYTGQAITRDAQGYYLLDGKDAYEQGLDILAYKEREQI